MIVAFNLRSVHFLHLEYKYVSPLLVIFLAYVQCTHIKGELQVLEVNTSSELERLYKDMVVAFNLRSATKIVSEFSLFLPGSLIFTDLFGYDVPLAMFFKLGPVSGPHNL